MRRTSTVTMCVAAVLLIVAGAVLAVTGDTWSGRPIGLKSGMTPGASASQSPAPAGASLDERLDPPAVLTQDMSVFWAVTYFKCGHVKVRESPPDAGMLGKTPQQFAGFYPDYTLVMTGGVIRMERTIGQYCPDHYIIKGDSAGNIYVYRNLDGLDKLTMVTKLTFSADAIPADYKPLLEQGMAFGSIEEIEGLIEDAES